MQKARRHPKAPTACKRMVSGSFHSVIHGLFTFPHGTSSLSVSQKYFSLTRWSWQIHTRFPVPRATQDTTINNCLYLYGTITLYGTTFQQLPVHKALNIVVLQPQPCRNKTGLGFSAFARHY